MIPLLEEDITEISMHMDAVQRTSLPKMDVALHAAKELSMRREDGTKQKSRQMDAARQNEMTLVDMV